MMRAYASSSSTLCFAMQRSVAAAATAAVSSRPVVPRHAHLQRAGGASSACSSARFSIASASASVRCVPPRATGDDAADAAADTLDASADDFAFEPKSKNKRRRRTGDGTKRATLTIDSPAIDAAKGVGERTATQQSEEAYVLFLAAYISLIFLGGLLLAVSAFDVLPENLNAWVEQTLYPSFSPFVVGFLGFSSIYGLIKNREEKST